MMGILGLMGILAGAALSAWVWRSENRRLADLADEYARGMLDGRRWERQDEQRDPLLNRAPAGSPWRATEHRRECGWCGVVMLAGSEPVTHGICPVCLAAKKAEMRRRAEELRPQLPGGVA